MHWQHLSTQYDELSYCFDGLPHESSSTIFASCKRISKLGWLAIYTQWVQVLYEEGFSFFHRYFYNISNSKKGEGSKSGQNCQRIVLKNCWHDGCQKSEKNADIVYGWFPVQLLANSYGRHNTMVKSAYACNYDVHALCPAYVSQQFQSVDHQKYWSNSITHPWTTLDEMYSYNCAFIFLRNFFNPFFKSLVTFSAEIAGLLNSV